MTLDELRPGQRFRRLGRSKYQYIVVNPNGLAAFAHNTLGLVFIVDLHTGALIAESPGLLVELLNGNVN
jgi:hypothetical protein